ncbi:MAG TPA: hypothetical protein VFT70_17840 [Nocardioides sp.]|nr:hypothetical protein [Nocardioides sp.]
MSSMTSRLRTATCGVLAAVLFLPVASTSTASVADPHRGVRELDLVASANPTAAEPAKTDDAYAYVVSRHRAVKADVAATGSATCDSCDAASTALQVLYVDHGRRVRLANTAAAWTQECEGCSAMALSVQVAVLRGVRAIAPDNRALAVNAACASCRVTGVAYQVVVRSQVRQLPRELLLELRAWVAEEAAALHAPAATSRRARAAAGSALRALEGLVTGELGAVTVSSDVALRR